jgi:adenylate kinase
VKYKTILLFGAPGAGKGTQGKILGSIPGFYHCACGDVFRALDLQSPLGQTFLEYSSRGALVPDDITIKLWAQQIDQMQAMGRFSPEKDFLILDGIPRNLPQAKILKDKLDVRRLFHLSCPDQNKLIERLKRRALHDNRFDDANESVIRARLETYENESKPVMEYYGDKIVSHIDSTLAPYQVLRELLSKLD